MIQLDMFSEPPATAPTLSLRGYQQKAVDNLFMELACNQSTLLVLATGLGKTRIACATALRFKSLGKRVLVLCPTIILCKQMYEAMRSAGLDVSLEQASNYATRPLRTVTVASVATMRGERLAGFKPTDFDAIVVDEAHYAIAERFSAIFDHFDRAKRIGLTATPDRTDGVSLRSAFGTVAFNMPIIAGIEQGWLAPLKFKTVHTNFDPSSLRTSMGDISPDSAAKELVRSGALHQAANALADLAGEDRAIAFLPTVVSSRAFISEINARYPRSPNAAQYAAHIDASTPEQMRNEYFEAFKDGTTRVLANVGCLVEGFDAPCASVVALLNPTKSRLKVCQMIGRGTRQHDGKTHAMILDFCAGRLKKGRLASPADALAGEDLPDDIADMLSDEGDLLDELNAAKAKAKAKADAIEEAKRKKAQAAAWKALRDAERARMVKAQKFEYEAVEHEAAELMAESAEDPEVARRKAAGLCLPKQAKLLKRYGLNPDLNPRMAGNAISALKKNNWNLPAHIRNDRNYYK